jgi:hypothetical protein
MKALAAIDSFIRWLRGLLHPGDSKIQQLSALSVEPSKTEVPSARGTTIEPPTQDDPRKEALAYLDRVRTKVSKLAEDFNLGTINRAQFRSLYVHYQHEIQSIERMVEAAPASDEWKGAMTEGQSMVIRRQHIARALGYAIFENDSGMPVSTLGQFELDPALFVPMLSSYRAAATEVFGSEMRSTEMQDGRWLCYVPGDFTTMLAIFGAEPAMKQLQFLTDLHHDFERANRRHLTNPPLNSSDLLFPHEYYLGQWRR